MDAAKFIKYLIPLCITVTKLFSDQIQEIEPNDDETTAQHVQFNDSINGSIFSSNKDFFLVKVTSPGYLSYENILLDSAYYIGLISLYDNIRLVQSDLQWDRPWNKLVNPGEYIVYVYDGNGSYSFVITFDSLDLSNVNNYGINLTMESAISVEPDKSVIGLIGAYNPERGETEKNWYSIHLEETKRVYFSKVSDSGQTYVSPLLNLYSGKSKKLILSTRTYDRDGFNLDSGLYYVQMYNEVGLYKFQVSYDDSITEYNHRLHDDSVLFYSNLATWKTHPQDNYLDVSKCSFIDDRYSNPFSALKCEGGSERFTLQNPATSLTSYTLSFWAILKSQSNYKNIITLRGGESNLMQLQFMVNLDGSGILLRFVRDNQLISSITIPETVFSNMFNNWNHFVFTHNDEGVGKIFINGMLMTECDMYSLPEVAYLNLGAGESYFGSFDDIILLDYALDDSKINIYDLLEIKNRNNPNYFINNRNPKIRVLINEYSRGSKGMDLFNIQGIKLNSNFTNKRNMIVIEKETND